MERWEYQGEVESYGRKQNHERNHASIGGRTSGERGDVCIAQVGRLESRAEKRLERAQDETRGRGDFARKQGVGGREGERAEVGRDFIPGQEVQGPFFN